METSKPSPTGGSEPQYTISDTEKPHAKALGHKLRIETDKQGHQTLHIDTAVGKFFREKFLGATYADATKSKEILNDLATRNPTNPDMVQAIKTAAVKTIVLTGKETDKVSLAEDTKTDNEALFKERNKKTYDNLVKDPVIAALNRHISFTSSTLTKAS